MKGKNKIVLPLLLAGIATTGVVSEVNMQQVAFASTPEVTQGVTNVAGVELGMVGGFEDTYDFGTPIKMPEVKADIGANGKILYEVINGEKTVESFELTKAQLEAGYASYEETLVFEPTYTGRYIVKITASDEGRVSSVISNLSFSVVRKAASITLPVNSKYVIPETVSVKQEGFKIPFPTVKVENEEGEEETLDVSQLDDKFTVKLITPSTTVALNSKKNNTDHAYDVDANSLNEAGTYKIVYEYRSHANPSEGVRLAYAEKTFQVSNDYEKPTSIIVKLNTSPSETGIVGTEVSIPKATAYDGKDKTTELAAHLRIWATHLESNTKTELSAEEVENLTFKPTKIGSYMFTYQADMSSLYNGLVSEVYSPEKIMKVYDTKAPTIVATRDYTVDGNGNVVKFNVKDASTFETVENDIEDGLTGVDLDKAIGEKMEVRDCDISSVVVREDGKCTIKLPAIYAYDNYDTYSNLTLKREIYGGGITRITVEDLINPATNEKYKPNESAEIEFTAVAGTYTIRYYAADKAVSSEDTTKADINSYTKTPSVVVKDGTDSTVTDELSEGKTTITLKVTKTSVSKTGKLSFEAPTVKDTHDSSLDVQVGYYLYSDKTGTTKINSDPVFIEKVDGKYEIDMTEISTSLFQSAQSIRVVVRATADEGLSKYRDIVTETTSKVITITNTDNDSECPTIAGIGSVATYDAASWNSELLTLNADIAVKNNSNGAIYGINEEGYATVDGDGTVLKNANNVSLAAFDQCTTSLTSEKNILKVPAFKISDKNKLSLSVTVTDEKGNIIPLHTQMNYESLNPQEENVGTADQKYTYTIDGVSFMLSSAGVYSVTYKAIDVNGNTLVKTFAVRVNDKTPPSIVVEEQEKFGTDIEVGEFFEIPYRYLMKDNKVLTEETVYWELYDQPDNIEIQPEITEEGFRAYAPGTYYIRFYGTDENLNLQMLQEDTKFFVNVVDTKAPEFNSDSEYILPSHVAWESGTTSKDIKIPLLRATDNDVTCSPKVVCTVTGPNGNTVTVKGEDDDDKDTLFFTATKEGIYTIKYEVTDKAGNKTTRTDEIKVGDYINPTLEWKNESTNLKQTVELNKDGKGTLTFDIGNLIIKDNKTASEDLDIDVKLVKPDGSTKLTNEGNSEVYKYTLDQTGDYKLTFTIKDEAGNKTTKDYTITVPSENPDKDEVSPVVGTVLVVVAVVILAGVVVYFVLSNKKKGAKVRKPSKKSKK